MTNSSAPTVRFSIVALPMYACDAFARYLVSTRRPGEFVYPYDVDPN